MHWEECDYYALLVISINKGIIPGISQLLMCSGWLGNSYRRGSDCQIV